MKKKRFISIFAAAAVSAFLIYGCVDQKIKNTADNQKITKFTLSPEEKIYIDSIKENPLVIAYSYDLVQARFDGEAYGMLDPILDILRDEFGLTIETVKLNWKEMFIQIENGEIDFYGPIALTEERRQKYISVDPFYRSYSKIITRIDDPMHSMLGLYNCVVGLLDGSAISRTMQAYLGPYGDIVYFPTFEDMRSSLESGGIHAFATVDNAEFEIFARDKIQFEFTIENIYVDQGLISGKEEMRFLASILNRYLSENPQINEKIVSLRKDALIRYSNEMFAEEIKYVNENFSELTIYIDPVFYPLCYMDRGTMKGMQVEINSLFETEVGVPIRFLTDNDYTNGIVDALEKIKSGECMAFIGAYYNIDIWNDPDFEYSLPIWQETLRTYSYEETSESLFGKTLGTILMASDYLGWNNTTGNPSLFYNRHSDMLGAINKKEIDAIFMGEMKYNYIYNILRDYNLREISGISAEATMHLLYGRQNKEINKLLNHSLVLYQVVNPRAMGQWKAQTSKYKADFIRLRHTQQVFLTAAFIVFSVMFAALIYLFIRVRRSLAVIKMYNIDLLKKVHIDKLTDIYNRRFFDENLSRLFKTLSRSSGMLSLLMIDVDFFKKYNDKYGHIMGDECLKIIASVLKHAITRSDDIAARYGGEEFIVVLPNSDVNGAKIIAEKLLECVRDRRIKHEASDAADIVTISIGIATGSVQHTQKAEDYIKKADEMLYQSKHSGRNKYTYGMI